MWLVITLVSLGEALIHYVLHHKAQVVMAVVGVAGWARSLRGGKHSRFLPRPKLTLDHNGRRVMPKAEVKAMKQARKAVPA